MADATAIVTSVNQTGHGFTVGKAIRSSGVDGQYALAKADTPANAEVVGIVSHVTDSDNFNYTSVGVVTEGVPVQAAGTTLFLSSAVAGSLTPVEPAISKPVAVITANAGAMAVMQYRGIGFLGAYTGAFVPAGGSTSQVLAKSSNTDYDVGWVTGGGADLTDVNTDILFHTDGAQNIGQIADKRPDKVYVKSNVYSLNFLATTTGIAYYFGSAANTYPGLKRSGTEIQVRLADDTADATIKCGTLKFTDNTTMTTAAVTTTSLAESAITFTDITTNNVSTTKHGYTPKAPNDATKYLDGTGAWTVPAGTSQWTNVTGGINYAGGKVGIDQASPVVALHVGAVGALIPGASDFNVAMNVYYNSGWKYIADGTCSLLAFASDGGYHFYTAASGTAGAAASITEKVTVLNNGKVGIGCSPTFPFQIHTGTDQNFIVAGKVTLSDGITIGTVNDAISTQKGLELQASAFLFTGGNVGINVAPALSKLHVASSASIDGITIVSVDRASIWFSVTDGSNLNWLMQNGVATNSDFQILASTTSGGTPTKAILVLNSAGSLGVNAAPITGSSLYVGGPAGATMYNRFDSAAGYGSHLQFGPAAYLADLACDSSGNFSISHTGVASSVMYSMATGSVQNTLGLYAGNVLIRVPNGYPGDAALLSNSCMLFYLVEGSNQLYVKVKYSTGTLKYAILNLS